MANNNIPAHDFAPSWLKIPSYDTTKGTQHSDGLHGNQREEHRSSFHRRLGGTTRPGYRERDSTPVLHPGGDRAVGHAPLGEENIRLGPTTLLGPPQGMATLPDKGLLPRRPHSRHDFRDVPQPAYHKLSPGSNSSSNHSAYPVGHLPRSGLGPPGGSKKDLAGNNFNQEFPTLLGGDQAPPQPPVVTSVWENPRNSKVHGTILKKVHLVQRPLRNDSATLEARSKSPSSGASVWVSSVVSAGTQSPKLARHPVTVVAPASKVISPSAQSSLYRALGPPAKASPMAGMHTMEVLVKHPKAKGNKGDFLKALRSGDDSKEGGGTKGGGGDSSLLLNDGCPGNGQCHPQEEEEERSRAELEATSGVGRLSLADPAGPEHAPLSSSLEAEQRLLREMGWKEEASDDDTYAPLTEDELREFQYLAKMRQEKQRNGVQQRVMATAGSDKTGAPLWSPRRVASVAPPFVAPPVVSLPQADNGWSSSSDTDSDGN
ncbi:unnamed protein product [Ixodes hexagonus]